MLKKLFSIFFTKKQKPNRHQHWIDVRGSVPKAGNTKQYCIGIILFLLIAAMSGCASSKYGTLNCGSKYKLIAPKFNK